MSATKSAKQGTRVQAAKAKTKARTATKKPTAKDAPKASPDECPRGGKHVWKDDGDGQPCCEKCFEPVPKEKKAKANKPAQDQSPKRLSAIDAAAKVLSDSKTAMNAKELIDAIAAQGLWSSPGGKTPHNGASSPPARGHSARPDRHDVRHEARLRASRSFVAKCPHQADLP